jgi:hypothetical protein
MRALFSSCSDFFSSNDNTDAVMFPVLVYMYVRLAHAEEREVLEEFGDEYAQYAATTPAFIPRLRRAEKVAGK